MTLGIMGAMPEEINRLLAVLKAPQTHNLGNRCYLQGDLWGYPVLCVFSRWGKVAAATTATTLITKFNVDRILFTGVAGATDPGLSLGDVVVGDEIFQHDMDARPFFAQHEIPLLGRSSFRTCPVTSPTLIEATKLFFDSEWQQTQAEAARHGITLRRPRVISGGIASGDKFFADHSQLAGLTKRLPSVRCVEMEGGAVAQVCHEYGIPFGIVRTISDRADDSAPVDFTSFVNHVASSYSYGIIKKYLGLMPL